MDINTYLDSQLTESLDLLQRSYHAHEIALQRAVDALFNCLMADGKILCCGNGSSGALAQYFAALMLNQLERDRPGLACIDLTSNQQTLGNITQHYDIESIFSKQIRTLGKPNDILLVYSMYPDEVNIKEAIHAAHERHMQVMIMTGNDTDLAPILLANDIQLACQSVRNSKIMESHLWLSHALCDALDYLLLGEPYTASLL